MGELLLLAVCSAFYPLYLAVVIVAFATDNPRKVLLGYLVGGAVSLVTVGIAVVVFFSGASFTRDQHAPISPGLNVAVGVLLVGAALLLRRWHPSAAGPDAPAGRTQRMIGSGRAPVAAAAGLLMNLVPGPAYIVGLKDITVGGYSTGEQIVLVLVFNVFQLSLIWIPLVGGLLAPQRTADLAGRFNVWLRVNGGLLLALASAALGVYLIARGIVLLVT